MTCRLHIDDVAGSGTLDDGTVSAGATVTATDLLASPHQASAKATARTGVVRIMPTADRPTGLLTARLVASQITCKSGVAVDAYYELRLRWPGVTTDQVSLANAASLPAPSSITFIEGGVTRNLSEYLTWGLATAVNEGANGIRSSVRSSRSAGRQRPWVAISAPHVGDLPCVADDNQ